MRVGMRCALFQWSSPLSIYLSSTLPRPFLPAEVWLSDSQPLPVLLLSAVFDDSKGSERKQQFGALLKS